jgi:hypothetical protein
MRNKTDEEILNLPVMMEPIMRAVIRLLLHISFYCYLTDEPLLAVYTSLLTARLTLARGISPYRAGAFA